MIGFSAQCHTRRKKREMFKRMLFAVVSILVSSSAQASLLTFTASLTPGQTTPPSGCTFNGAPCSGTAVFTVDTVTFDIALSMQYTVGAAWNLHLNDGAPGINGPTEIFLRGDMSTACGTGTFCRTILFTDGFVLPSNNLSDLIAGNDYILVTQATGDPDGPGLIRGQLQAVPEPGSISMLFMAFAVGLAMAGKRTRGRCFSAASCR